MGYIIWKMGFLSHESIKLSLKVGTNVDYAEYLEEGELRTVKLGWNGFFLMIYWRCGAFLFAVEGI